MSLTDAELELIRKQFGLKRMRKVDGSEVEFHDPVKQLEAKRLCDKQAAANAGKPFRLCKVKLGRKC